ncbi:Sterol 24-C-methyltransferase [Trichoderma simmonsii]|uniref:Sterol 24-C-methyltransferase n=1 Tax=Trichoderma simmonsii TaxID=1491479 RepID=A0A8G0PMX2_9HYPO|nr:Sterol 24-C-methyltransferase [Trichoderma simmonsii]
MVNSTSQALLPADQARNMAFDKILHKSSSNSQGGLRAMINKDNEAHKAAVVEYFQHWDGKKAEDETEAVRQSRVIDYASLTRQYGSIFVYVFSYYRWQVTNTGYTERYYNLATDLYEYGWGEAFHFCRFAYGEAFKSAVNRHEHYLASSIGIKPGMRVLDVGCGVGGPAREIVKFTGCHVTGLNINNYQISRAKQYAVKEGLTHKLDFVQGDFMNLPFPDDSFDAVYVIEATVHAPSLESVYREIFRVLKPGGVFGVYEWFMTDAYNNDDLAHRQIRLDIEQGDGIAQMLKVEDGLAAIQAAGFTLETHYDLADDPNDTSVAPWYWPLGTDLRYAQSLSDVLTVLRMNRFGRVVSHAFISVLELLQIAPAGTGKTAESLAKAADALVEGGKKKLFTPMYLMVGRKPEF